MNEYRSQEEKFKEEIKTILSKAIPDFVKEKYYTLTPSSGYEDTALSYDMIFNLCINISVRIRKHEYKKYKDLTIRTKSSNGGKTEGHKIKEGKAQIYFYAYMTENELGLDSYYIVDVDAIRNLINKKLYGKERCNNDGTKFVGFKFDLIQKESIENNFIFINKNNNLNQTKIMF